MDYKKLSDFLKKIYPLLKQEIDEANHSQAFRNYRVGNDDDDDGDKKCKRIQNVEVRATHNGSGESDGADVSAIAWNCTGNTLAISTSFKHEDWCYHAGVVSFYGLGRDEKLSAMPVRKLGVDSCVNVICFHPAVAFVVAVGLFSGVFVM